MYHMGDVTKINGAKATPVNVIIGGSPCQDLSIAGKRAGLNGERSGLFMEQLRIIKEMRKADVNNGRTSAVRPRYMVWENVPGAFSSNGGEDFGAVLQETVRVVVEQAPVIPIPKKRGNGGGWPTSGCISGLGDSGVPFSVAWRVFDAQFWGVPQRRRRIALVADFGGLTAPEILFERESVSGDTETCRTPWEVLTRSTESGFARDDSRVSNGGERTLIQCNMIPTYCIQGNCIDRADTAGCNGKGWTEDVSYTLNTIDRPAVSQPVAGFMYRQGSKAHGIGYAEEQAPTLCSERIDSVIVPIHNHPADSRVTVSNDGVVQTLTGRMGTGGGNVPMLLQGQGINGDKAGTLDASYYKGCGERGGIEREVVAQTMTQNAYDTWIKSDISATLKAAGGTYKGGSESVVIDSLNQHYIVRRLTPLECERLQGYPDHWTDIGPWTDAKGKLHKESADNARYKALGNSIALPPWLYVLQRLSVCCGTDHTMASLFDGIGGFPFIWEMLHGAGTCLWASEIEDFPIAVTKKRFTTEEEYDDEIPRW